MILFYYLYRAAQFLAIHLPLKGGYWLAETIADIKYYLWPKDTKKVKKNLRLILGKNNLEINRISRQVFKNFGRYLVEFFRFHMIDKDYIDSNIKIVGLENIDKSLSFKKGVVVLSCHLSNWELGAAAMAMNGYPMTAVVINHKFKKIDDIFKTQRASKGIEIFELGGAFIKCLNALYNNKLVAVLGDVDFARHGIKMKFFNKTTSIPKGPAMLSLKTGAAIVPGFMVRKDKDKYELIFEKPISYQPTGKIEYDVLKLTEKIVESMENYIRRYPSQWLMFREFWTEPGEVI